MRMIPQLAVTETGAHGAARRRRLRTFGLHYRKARKD